MIGEVCIATKRWSFEDICEELYSPPLAFFTGFVNAISCIFCAAAYLIVFGQAFQSLTGSDRTSAVRFQIIVGVCVCLPLALGCTATWFASVNGGGVAVAGFVR